MCRLRQLPRNDAYLGLDLERDGGARDGGVEAGEAAQHEGHGDLEVQRHDRGRGGIPVPELEDRGGRAVGAVADHGHLSEGQVEPRVDELVGRVEGLEGAGVGDREDCVGEGGGGGGEGAVHAGGIAEVGERVRGARGARGGAEAGEGVSVAPQALEGGGLVVGRGEAPPRAGLAASAGLGEGVRAGRAGKAGGEGRGARGEG